MDVLLRSATRSITIVGINLEGVVIGLSSILNLANSGGTIRLLAMDPDGACITPSAAMSGVDAEIRRQKIRQNLNLIRNQLLSTLSKAAQRHVSLCVIDAILPVSVTIIDQNSAFGSLIAQHHLRGTPAENAPMIYLSKKDDPEWFPRYLEQTMSCFTGSREWQ